MKIQAFHTAFGEDNQVFSSEEILDEVKLFSGAYKEEEDERLKFLYFLRQFKKLHRTWFDKIKKMPLKSRAGRNSKKINRPELMNGTAAFFKTEKKFDFYWVGSDNEPMEITPIEAFKIFESTQEEKNAPLIDTHHEHVNKAMEYFENLEHKILQSHADPEALGGVAQRAKKFLSDLIKYPQLTEKQKDNILKIVVLIDIGKYTNLPTDIDRLQKKKANLTNALSELDKVAAQYNVDNSDAQKGKKGKVEKPVLIISESFE
jgi:hypothetical protein